MAIDTSALLAILEDEPERRSFNERIEAAAIRRLSTASFVETSIVIEARYGPPRLARRTAGTGRGDTPQV